MAQLETASRKQAEPVSRRDAKDRNQAERLIASIPLLSHQ
jgi:hypothetical protein